MFHSSCEPKVEFMGVCPVTAAIGEIATVVGAGLIYDLDSFERVHEVQISALKSLQQDFTDLKEHIVFGWMLPVQVPTLWGGKLVLYTKLDDVDHESYFRDRRTSEVIHRQTNPAYPLTPLSVRGFLHRVSTLFEVHRDPILRTWYQADYDDIIKEFEVIARKSLVAYRAELNARDIEKVLAPVETTSEPAPLESGL